MAKKELDRFETNYKKDMTIRTKLMGIIIGAVLLSCIVTAVLSINIYSKKQMEKETHLIDVNATGMLRVIDEWRVQLVQYTYLFAAKDSLSQSLYNNDGKFGSIVDDLVAHLDLDFYAITDAQGKIIKAHDLGGDITGSKAVKSALKGELAWFYEPIDSHLLAAVSAAPLKYEGKLVGTVVLGYTITNDFIGQEGKDSYAVETMIFSNDVRAYTTIKDSSGKTHVGTKLEDADIVNTVLKKGKSYSGEVSIEGNSYMGCYKPIVCDDGSVAGMIFVAKSLASLSQAKQSTIMFVAPVCVVICVLLFIFAGSFVSWLMWRIKKVSNLLEEMASGDADLTKRCALYIRDEIGFLVINFDAFCDKLQNIVSEIKTTKLELTDAGTNLASSIEDTASSFKQISANIDNVSTQIVNSGNSVGETTRAVDDISTNINTLDTMIQQQSTEVTEAASAVQEMIGNITSVNHSVELLAESFKGLSANTNTGFVKQQDVNEKIKQIEVQSEMLQEANLAISSIAEQTNLLAMNAAIEAAHAGEAGKGFSVVADEIRKLSETSSQQSKTIGDQLTKIKDSISEVVSASRESQESFEAVSSKLQETDELVVQIKSAMEEQTAGSQQISQALKSMSDSTSDVNSASKNMAAKKEIIQAEIRKLENITSDIQSSMNEMTESEKKISVSSATLDKISAQVENSINKIGSQIDLFTV